jgi:shikimate dehydrogenase
MSDRYAVIGNPIEHSKSPQIHTAFAQQEKIQISYERILATEEEFTDMVNKFKQQGGLGLNVTVPFKIIAYQQCSALSAHAQAAKAVNTISFNQAGEWLGANTDGIGLLRDLTDNLGYELTDKKILVLGAGGASRGILLPLLEEHPTSIIIANRTLEKAEQLANEFSSFGNITACGYDHLENLSFDLIINATSSSLSNQVPPVPNEAIGKECLCYDLMYSHEDTAFMAWAKSHHAAKVSDGLGMLIEQAAESYFIWRGFRPDTSQLFTQFR